MKDVIKIKGARTHNLKNIDIDIPREKLVVLTGLSGSGKSSLAFDTLYAEGQRRYVESLSSYARQFLGMIEKPDLDSIEGLSPAISIDQKTTSKNPRSTVGTVTEIHDYLRLLFARIGQAHCPRCKQKIKGQSIEQITEQILGRGDVIVAAPIIRSRKGQYKKLFRDLEEQGFSRVIVDGEIYTLDSVSELDRYKKHDISLVIDRLSASQENSTRLTHAISLAIEKSGGLAEIFNYTNRVLSPGELHSQSLACPDCGYALPELEPRLFSFNSPKGACSNCQGIGYIEKIDPNLFITDPSLTIEEGALRVFEVSSGRYEKKSFFALIEALGLNIKIPWDQIPKKQKEAVLYGSDEKITIRYRNRFGRERVHKNIRFEGVVRALEKRYEKTESAFRKDNLGKYMAKTSCTTCLGQRLSPDSLAVLIHGKNIADLSALSIQDIDRWIQKLKLTEEEEKIGGLIVREIAARLQFLLEVGLDYLSLDRPANTLSGGESQRIRLATQIGSRLVGVLYILDEPSIGLHPRDNHLLIQTLKELRDLGNSVIVVEHDRETMLESDWIVDLGPGAGEHGGEIVAEGSPSKIKKSKGLTGAYLAGRDRIEIPERRKGDGEIKIEGVKTNNLKNINATFKLSAFNCVTGVSGSGKSSLVTDTLYPALSNRIMNSRLIAGEYQKISGVEKIGKVIAIDQTPIGRTPRSNPATYIGLFDPIRTLFSQTKESRARGYKPGRFSFNVEGGRCETCKGDGEIKIEMHFLADVHITCEKCKGKRYNKETLEIDYKNKNISEVLDMTVEEALLFFDKIPKIKRRLKTLSDVGLGYIRLGQPATTLSGGEAQRVKLASELSRVATGDTVYILDEPTTGLHFDDIKKLISVLNRLVDAKNTVIVIEHNLDIVKSADWILDIGPDGGERGGRLVAAGAPEKVAKTEASFTGEFLREEM